MDQPFPEARRHLHLVADLLGAVRLPAGATAGSPAWTCPPTCLSFGTGPTARAAGLIHVDDRDVEINTYFENNIGQVLGTVGADPLAWGPAAVTVSSTPDRLDRDLAEALSNVTAEGLRAGLTYVPHATRPVSQEPSGAGLIRPCDRQAAATPPRPHLRHVHGRTGLDR